MPITDNVFGEPELYIHFGTYKTYKIVDLLYNPLDDQKNKMVNSRHLSALQTNFYIKSYRGTGN